MLTIISSELVIPCEVTPRKPLWLSNLDLAGRKAHTAMVYFYRPNDSTRKDFFSVESMRSSLAKALVPFYPLAGRLGEDSEGRTEINCNGEGALFIVARSNAMLDDFGNFAPSVEMRNFFVPPTGEPDQPCPLLMVQVTFFKCGGVALGTAMHHMLVDGRSAFHFMETWSHIANGEDGDTVPPFFDHTLLSARPERKVLFDHSEYKSNPKSTVPSDIPTMYAISVQEISDKHIDALKIRCKDKAAGARVSTFCAITTLVWRCFCMARNLDTGSESKLYTMIDMRNRMRPPLPPTYFGNAVIRISVSELVNNIISSPISQVAERVHEATKKGDGYARSLIDYLETADMGNLPRSGVPITELRVISWLGMPTHNADFGWGKQIFFVPIYYSGYVFLMDSLGKDGGVSIVVSLEPESLPEFEKLFSEELASLHV